MGRKKKRGKRGGKPTIFWALTGKETGQKKDCYSNKKTKNPTPPPKKKKGRTSLREISNAFPSGGEEGGGGRVEEGEGDVGVCNGEDYYKKHPYRGGGGGAHAVAYQEGKRGNTYL